MQKITVDFDSPLAEGLINSKDGVMLVLKEVGGKSVFRGIVNQWKTSEVEGHFSTEIELQDWDSYWGDMAARRYGV